MSRLDTALAIERTRLADQIAEAIERAVCEPSGSCDRERCTDCARYTQAQADAATARRIGAST